MDTAVLRFFEALRRPLLDALFQAFSALGEETAVAAAVALVYICFSRRTGEQALITLLTASAAAAGLKGAVRRLRPYAAGTVTRVELHGILASTLNLDADMSFPSGHAVASAAFGASLALRLKRLPVTLPAAVLPLLVGLSRVYLGVHNPSDVLAGLALGLLAALAWQAVFTRFFGGRLYVFAAAALLCIPLLFFERTATGSAVRLTALLLGAAAGLLTEDTFARLGDAAGWKARALRLLITGAFAGAAFLPAHLFLPAAGGVLCKYAAGAFAALGLAPLLLKKLRL